MTRARSGQWAAAVVVVVLGLAYVVFVRPAPSKVHVTAVFSETVGLYAGDDVRLVGVPVGTVTAVRPNASAVRVEMVLDAGTPVAADTGAVIVPPGVISSRYVQLTHPWTAGPRLADGATISAARTTAPLELDDVSQQLSRFLKALGPDGANREGALSRVVASSAAGLAGNGAKLRSTLADLAAALDTLGSSSDDIVGTIENLRTFASTLAASDGDVRQVERHLAAVSRQLAAQGPAIREGIRDLDLATRAIRRFMTLNQDNLTADLKELATLSITLEDRKRELTEFLDLAPLGAQNIIGAGNLDTGTVDTRIDIAAGDAGTSLCNILQQAGVGRLCDRVTTPAQAER